MKKAMILGMAVFVFLMMSGCVSAFERSGHIHILAVNEAKDEVIKQGSVADLYLEIKDGEGRVFIETFPFAQYDTQISTRFAKEVACKFLEKDCSRYDFFYRIEADASIIGGPSAGAAIGVLTAALLDNSKVDDDVAITGTMTSGGIIGPVGGVKEKIEAAQEKGLKKVIIPKQGEIQNLDNVTLNYTQYGKELGIKVIAATKLGEALEEVTGKRYPTHDGDISVDGSYQEVMRGLALELCQRSESLKNEYERELNKVERDLSGTDIEGVTEDTLNYTRQADEAFSRGDYYSAASYCFGANVNYHYMDFYLQDISIPSTLELVNKTRQEIQKERADLFGRKISTITDLQTFMIVSERLRESEELLETVYETINNTAQRSYGIAYSIERLYSAYSWSSFFDTKGEEYNFDQESLQEGCTLKLLEAEELLKYVSIYYPPAVEEQTDMLNAARKDKENKDYISCLFKASKSKAESSVIMSAIGVDEDMLGDLITLKLEVAKEAILTESMKKRFPIVGYSYYEYANSLKESSPYSALVYAEYALEMSNLDFYFKKKHSSVNIQIDWKLVLIFVLGAAFGYVLSIRKPGKGESKQNKGIQKNQVKKKARSKKGKK